MSDLSYDDSTDTLSEDARLAATLERVRFEAGMLLGVDATQAEQRYHRRRQTRQQYWLAGYGTLAGMRVSVTTGAESTQIVVGQGLGIDSLGREVLVHEAYCINLDAWLEATDLSVLVEGQDGNDLLLKVTVRHSDCAVAPAPTAARRLNFGTDGVSYSRIRDQLLLELTTTRPVAGDTSLRPWANHDAVPELIDVGLTATETAFLGTVLDPEAQAQLELHARMLGAFDSQSLDPGIPEDRLTTSARLLLADLRIPMTDFAAKTFDPTGIEVNNLTRPFLATASQIAWLRAE